MEECTEMTFFTAMKLDIRLTPREVMKISVETRSSVSQMIRESVPCPTNRQRKLLVISSVASPCQQPSPNVGQSRKSAESMVSRGR